MWLLVLLSLVAAAHALKDIQPIVVQAGISTTTFVNASNTYFEFTLDLNSGTTDVFFSLVVTGGSSDFQLYVARDGIPTPEHYDWMSDGLDSSNMYFISVGKYNVDDGSLFYIGALSEQFVGLVALTVSTTSVPPTLFLAQTEQFVLDTMTTRNFNLPLTLSQSDIGVSATFTNGCGSISVSCIDNSHANFIKGECMPEGPAAFVKLTTTHMAMCNNQGFVIWVTGVANPTTPPSFTLGYYFISFQPLPFILPDGLPMFVYIPSGSSFEYNVIEMNPSTSSPMVLTSVSPLLAGTGQPTLYGSCRFVPNSTFHDYVSQFDAFEGEKLEIADFRACPDHQMFNFVVESPGGDSSVVIQADVLA